VTGERLTIWSTRSLPYKCLPVFKGTFNTIPYHAKDHRLGGVLILHHLGAKMHTIMIKRALKGCNGILGKGEKREDTFGQLEVNSLKAREQEHSPRQRGCNPHLTPKLEVLARTPYLHTKERTRFVHIERTSPSILL